MIYDIQPETKISATIIINLRNGVLIIFLVQRGFVRPSWTKWRSSRIRQCVLSA